jgi:hypothetical protein
MDRIYCLGYPRHRLRGVRPDACGQSAGGDRAYHPASTILGLATSSRFRLAWCNGLLCLFQTQQQEKTRCSLGLDESHDLLVATPAQPHALRPSMAKFYHLQKDI